MIKRCFDIAAAGIGLVVLLPIFVAVAVLVMLHDGGPPFFRQERVGYRGRLFRIWKFRTMLVDADKRGPKITKGGDSRVTPIGRFLRKWKIDELPQLINVLCGEMSLVGPRPEVAQYVALYSEAQKEILNYRPGITDLAAIEFRDEEALLSAALDAERLYREHCIPLKIKLDLEYSARASFLNDIRLIVRTFTIIVRRG